MRIFFIVLGFVWALLTGIAPTSAQEARRSVSVDIKVVQASRTAGKMDPKLKKQVKLTKQIRSAGFKSARISDALSTTVEVGSSVGIEVLAQPKPRLLQVRVKEVTAEKKIKLTVGIKALSFEIDTEHGNGGTIVVAHPQGPDAALFLAVTPRLLEKPAK